MKNIGIYSRILLMLILIGVILLFFSSTLYFIKNKQEKLVIKESQNQFNIETNSLNTLKTATLKQVVFDYTYWDEFVENLKIKDTAWYNNNITTILKSFRIDYVCVCDTLFNIVHEASSDGFVADGFVSKEAIARLRETKFINFFQVTSNGVFEISGGTIHPDYDPSHTLTKPSGYLFLAKSWNQDFLEELETLSGAKIDLLMPSDSIANIGYYSISSVQKLPGWDGNIVAKYIFTRTSNSFKLYHKMSVYMLLIIFGSFFTTLLIFHFTTRKWINKPLKLVTNILKSGNLEQINELQNGPGEFKNIGFLFSEFINQKEELRLAKEKAEESDRLNRPS